MLDQCFSTYIYSANVDADKLAPIQDELLAISQHLKDTNIFKKRWTQDTHSLSDPSFSSNDIAKYGLRNFEIELDNHVTAYLDALSYTGPRKYKIKSAWFTLNKTNEHSRLHTHGNVDLSGVYYIQTNGHDGDLFFHTPALALGASMIMAHLHDTLYAKPEVGKIIMFPGTILHGVSGNDTKDDRISISFNLEFIR